jgi:3-carboxy-cis,cis-muconate cycloisomerase
MSDLFGGVAGPLAAAPAVAAATSDQAWLRALLATESALATAQAAAGIIPPDAAKAIATTCDEASLDPTDLGRRATSSASVVVPLVADLRNLVGEPFSRYVHHGATSQDITDTAMSLVAANAVDAILTDLAAAGDSLAHLAADHRDTIQLGRTLLQPAKPITFGLTCATWLTGVDEARGDLARIRRERLAVQLGGPVGSSPDEEVVERVARELGLVVPILPWHTTRNRVGELAGALGVVAGAVGVVGVDVALLAQGELREVAEGEPGGSSAMAYKKNPARAVQVTACAQRVPGLVATVLAGMPQELQRAVGRWQAESATVTELLRVTGGAVGHARALLAGLRVDPDAMRRNLDAAGLPADATDSAGRTGDARGAGELVDRALRVHGELA